MKRIKKKVTSSIKSGKCNKCGKDVSAAYLMQVECSDEILCLSCYTRSVVDHLDMSRLGW